jgi:hypothetical protein
MKNSNGFAESVTGKDSVFTPNRKLDVRFVLDKKKKKKIKKNMKDKKKMKKYHSNHKIPKT